jgi:hypothetical protein
MVDANPRPKTYAISARYVLNDGSFPVAPVVVRRPEGLSPINGTHRLAVLSAIQLIPEANFTAKRLAKPANEQDVWQANKRRRMASFQTHNRQDVDYDI